MGWSKPRRPADRKGEQLQQKRKMHPVVSLLSCAWTSTTTLLSYWFFPLGLSLVTLMGLYFLGHRPLLKVSVSMLGSHETMKSSQPENLHISRQWLMSAACVCRSEEGQLYSMVSSLSLLKPLPERWAMIDNWGANKGRGSYQQASAQASNPDQPWL